MSEIVESTRESHGHLSDLIHKGLGTSFSFLKKELGDRTYSEVE